MTMNLGKTLAIAAGIGAVGIGGYMLLKGKGDKEADGAEDPTATDPSLTGPPTGTTMAPGLDQTGQAAPPATGMPGSGIPATGTTQAAGQGQLQGEQVGPYTIVPDPQSGLQVVFETATQQPVGVVDAQGNITPITVDANGNIQLAQDPSTQSALGTGSGPASHPGVTATTGGVPGAVSTAPGTIAGATDADRGAVYQQIAADLFAGASDPMVGAARSDSMSGVANIAPAPGMQAGAVGASGPAAATGTISGGGVRTTQAGEFTLVDDGSGVTLVLDTASQQPVARMDAAGNITPIAMDAGGTVAVAGGGAPGMVDAGSTMPAAGMVPTTGALPTTPSMAGAAIPGY